MATKAIKNSDLEVTKFLDKAMDTLKENCQEVIDNVKSARETGSKNAKELVANIHINDKADELITNTSGFVGELMGAGFAMLMCPAVLAEKNFKKATN